MDEELTESFCRESVADDMFVPRLIEGLNNLQTYDCEVFHWCLRYVENHKIALHAEKQYIEKKKKAVIVHENEDMISTLRWIVHSPFESWPGIAYLCVTILLVTLNCLSVCLETVPKFNDDVNPEYANMWFLCEMVPTLWFTLDALLNFTLCQNKRLYVRNIINLCDWLSILPFYINLVDNTMDPAPLRIIRLTRIMKFFRHFKGIDTLYVALQKSFRALIGPVVFLVICIVLTAAFVYFAEMGVWDRDLNTYMSRDCECESSLAYILGKAPCPTVETRYFSIPSSFWWAAVTLATVGYGDITPQCYWGKVLAGCSMLLGVFFLSMPIAIVGGYFTLTVETKSQHHKHIQYRGVSRRRTTTELVNVSFLGSMEINDKLANSMMQFLFLNYQNPEPISLNNPPAGLLHLLDEFLLQQQFDCPKCGKRMTMNHHHDTFELHALKQEDARLPRIITLEKAPIFLLGPDVTIGLSGLTLPLVIRGQKVPLANIHGALQVLWHRRKRKLVKGKLIHDDKEPVVKFIPPSDKKVFVGHRVLADHGLDLVVGDEINLNTPQFPCIYRLVQEDLTDANGLPTSPQRTFLDYKNSRIAFDYARKGKVFHPKEPRLLL